MYWNTFMSWKRWKIALFKWFNICSSLYTVELPVGEQRCSQLSWFFWDSLWKSSGTSHKASVQFSRTRGGSWHTRTCMLSCFPISPIHMGWPLEGRRSHGQSQRGRSSGTKSVKDASFWRHRRVCLLLKSRPWVPGTVLQWELHVQDHSV